MQFLKPLFTVMLVLLLTGAAQAQNQIQDDVTKEFKDKVSELYTRYKIDGFVTYKGGTIHMEKNTEFPIYVQLTEGRWYQFAVIGDPEAKKLELKLGMEGIGEIITDKFRTADTNEYWTTFSFICPRSGNYLLTFFQKGSKKDMQGHVAIMQKPQKTQEGAYTYK